MSRDVTEIKEKLNVSFAQAAIYTNALKYMDNVGECKIEWFDEDQEPIGPQLRKDMVKHGAAFEQGGFISPAF